MGSPTVLARSAPIYNRFHLNPRRSSLAIIAAAVRGRNRTRQVSLLTADAASVYRANHSFNVDNLYQLTSLTAGITPLRPPCSCTKSSFNFIAPAGSCTSDQLTRPGPPTLPSCPSSKLLPNPYHNPLTQEVKFYLATCPSVWEHILNILSPWLSGTGIILFQHDASSTLQP